MKSIPQEEKILWGQRTSFACLVNQKADFLEELKLFAEVVPEIPAIANLFSSGRKN